MNIEKCYLTEIFLFQIQLSMLKREKSSLLTLSRTAYKVNILTTTLLFLRNTVKAA